VEGTLGRVNARLQIALVLVAVFALGAVVLAAQGDDDEPGTPSGDTPLSEVFEGARLPERLPAPEFSLRNQDGETVTMSDLRGSPVIVTFLYTNCDNTCPAQAQTIKGALADLDEDVPALAIAVDPPRDTPDSARRFLAEQRMSGRLDFVLGTRQQLQAIWIGYSIRPQSVREEHTGRFVLVDKRGFQRVGFPLDKATPEGIAHDLKLLQAE
jgi:protein SCO1